ncbi:hypothetical protein BS50DRAFT_632622 [Corynespora cassiicola Philippines]|uniref:Uncharacterized protein n=1 Tax=Corynespora cassiicola Philippines TaxID=1448308 RepID=A0A2T2NUH3_CORCC|nr:hypothetical protein BS50DRAFT_632622 [Corynespora cassiicola Philippines]
MRLTRAALRAEATQTTLQGDTQTVDASNTQADLRRVPLGEVSANAPSDTLEIEQAPPTKMPPKKSKAKGGAKKGARGKNTKDVGETHVEVVEINADGRDGAGSPASDAPVDELANAPTNDITQVPMSDMHPASPPSRAVRMTRRQLAKQEEELSKSQRPQPQPEPVVEPVVEDATAGAQEENAEAAESPEEKQELTKDTEPSTAEDQKADTHEEPEATASEVTSPIQITVESQEPEAVAPSVEVTSELEPKTLTADKPCEEDSTPATSRTPSRAPSRSPSRSPAKTPMRLEQSFEAIDALEEALDNVGKAFGDFDGLDEEKSPKKARFPRDVTAPTARGDAAKKSSAAPRVSKAPSAAAPKSLKPEKARPSLGRAASTRAASNKDKEARKGSAEVVDYLAAKRRPISMTFPAPPPPPKSTKAPTKPTFQLSSDAVAAKLKAQKEERLKREAEGQAPKARPLSMPPPPKSTKPPTKPNFQLPGEAIAAKLKAQREERLKREAEGEAKAPRPLSMPPPPKSTKPPTVPNFKLPGEEIAAKLKAQKEERLKREAEEAEAAKKAALKARPAPSRKPAPLPIRQASTSRTREQVLSKDDIPGVTISAPPRRTSSSHRSSILVPARSVSTSSATSSRNSLSLVPSNPGPVVKSTVTPEDVATQRLKGREIFNKDRTYTEERERERREKEEAAKRARAEAAERGRIASREWAERQRKKMMGVMGKMTGKGAA